MLVPHVSFAAARFLARVVVGSLALGCAAQAAQSYSRINRLFDGGTTAGNNVDGLVYHSYRIPAIVRGADDVLIAFAEGRRNSNSDWDETNLVYRRSFNKGSTWEGAKVLEGVGPGVWGNPTAVYEPTWAGGPSAGRIHVFFNWHSDAETGMSTIQPGDRKTYYTYSDNNGDEWAPKQDLTATLKPTEMAWDAVGPGVGIYKTLAPNAGMLVIPATNRNFYSTNHGASWTYQMLGDDNTGESTVVECWTGDLLRNDRVKQGIGSINPPDNYRRWVSYGSLAGGFPAPVRQANLYCPLAQASILRYNMNAPDRIIFLNSDATGVNNTRCRMKVRISYDDGVTWPRERWLYVGNAPDNFVDINAARVAGKGGYSSMAKTSDAHIAALVESNDDPGEPNSVITDHISIDFHRFNLDWITNGLGDPPP